MAKNSRPIWLEANYVPVQNRHGRVIKIVKLGADVIASSVQTMNVLAGELQGISGDITGLSESSGCIGAIVEGIAGSPTRLTSWR